MHDHILRDGVRLRQGLSRRPDIFEIHLVDEAISAVLAAEMDDARAMFVSLDPMFDVVRGAELAGHGRDLRQALAVRAPEA